MFLALRFEQERAIRERKRREREEQHLYVNMRIITGRQFTAHTRFDLAAWEGGEAPPEALPIEFKFKKAKKVRELVEFIAAEQGYQPEQIRLWIMVNRQNKTIRPDTPIVDLEKSKSTRPNLPSMLTMN